MVFYLKYRPRKISELDSQDLVEKFESILKGKLPDNIPHAFLFTGPKGLGKTSSARILAKAINCTNRKDDEIEPCDKCDSCKSTTNGSNLDVLEIDAASNRGIDEIRDLREKIRLSPVISKKKIYIIDEVHMLTTEAFNALLKTLEEPPKHAFFILCTTEPQKLPDTIISRCFHVKFTKATDEDLIHSFKRIIKGEGFTADKNALLSIAKLSDGSFRDGTKILEELSVSSNEITIELIEAKYKTSSINKYVNDLIKTFEERDMKSGISLVSNLVSENVDFKLFTEALINSIHKNLISQIGGEMFNLSVDQNKKLIEMLVKSHTSIKYALLPQLPLELTIVEWAAIGSEISQKLEHKEPLQDPKPVSIKKPTTIPSESGNILESLIEGIKKENFSIAGVLRGCSLEKLSDEELILSTEYRFHKERLNDPKIRTLIENRLLEITGKNLKFSVK